MTRNSIDWPSLRAQRHRVVRPGEMALCRIVFPDGSWTLEVIPTHKDARFYSAGGEAPRQALESAKREFWARALEWKPKPQRTGPKTKPEQDRIKNMLAKIGPPPDGMSIEKQAKRLNTTKRSLERYLAGKVITRVGPPKFR